MAFSILFSDESAYELKKLDNATAKRIILRINQASENPSHFFERLSGRDEFKLKAGDYRILAMISQKDNMICIQSLGHRKNIYKK